MNLNIFDIENLINNIDIEKVKEIVTFISTFVVYGGFIEGKKRIKLCKNEELKEIIIRPDFKYEKKDFEISNTFNQEMKDVIINFIKTLKEKNPDFSYELLFNNLTTLTKTTDISYFIKSILHFIYIDGAYSTVKNKISIYNYKNEVITHELLHAASTLFTGKVAYCGFSQSIFVSKTKTYGRAINEGYTQVLNKKYFNDTTKSYEYQAQIAKYLEGIVGEKNMEYLYFKADLYHLIALLTRYNDVTSVLNFIVDTDKLLYIKYNPLIDRKVEDKLNSVAYFLVESCLNKYKDNEDLENKCVNFFCTENQINKMLKYSFNEENVRRLIKQYYEDSLKVKENSIQKN